MKNKNKNKLLIIGAGSVGGHLAVNLKNYNDRFEVLGFLDDDKEKIGNEFVGFPVLGDLNSITNYDSTVQIAVGIAFPFIKSEIIKNLKLKGYYNFPNFISKNAWISNLVRIGEGCIIYPGTSVNYNSIIENFVVMNMNCAVGHDCVLKDYVSLAPNVSLGGNTTINELTELGIGSNSLQCIAIGKRVVVGAGAVITRNFKDNVIVIGNPAKIIRNNN
ncbi:acetyltransferase [Mesonia ostreae]|uniref:Acetyltransferase n=1 Tax=Mesonia ostreae TaxID=861110 RepID=A0ABU2KH65_9FLAO|nr:acetyltransferase [Mesonia ostreae]MDT0294055.1 acetyltransferase [Mesonia ostreae]